MASFDLVVHFEHWQYLLNINTNETLTQLKNQIGLTCGINLNNEEYVLEIFDDCFGQYVVFTPRYLTELYKDIPTTANRRFNARLRSRYSNDVPSQVPIQSPNCTIVWLDEYIGQQQEHKMLIQKFCLGLDVKDDDYLPAESLNKFDNLTLWKRKRWDTTLQIFNNVEECYRFVRTNIALTSIFFVTSSNLGRLIMPSLIDQVRGVYVLRSDVEENLEWLFDYLDCSCSVLFFDHEIDLLARLARDIA
ncbi:unnamed protein product, partial [Adineta ricciae]